MEPRADLLALGHALRRARELRGWSQIRLASEAGVNDRTVMRLELGRHPAGIDTLWDIAAALGVSLAQLISEAELATEDD